MTKKVAKQPEPQKGTAVFFRINDENTVVELNKLAEKDQRNSLADYIRSISIKMANGELVLKK
jgi:hypothetical protein